MGYGFLYLWQAYHVQLLMSILVLSWLFLLGACIFPWERICISFVFFSPHLAPTSELIKGPHWALVKSIALFSYLHPASFPKRMNRKQHWFPGVDEWMECSWHWSPHPGSMCKNWGQNGFSTSLLHTCTCLLIEWNACDGFSVLQ